MTSSKDTRTLILDTAQEMVQRQSIGGVSFQEIADKIGIKKGSLYYHFKTKDDLSMAMLERARQDLKASFERGLSKPAKQQLLYYLEIYRRFIVPGERMCPGGALASEWDKLSDPVKNQVDKLIKVQFEGVKNILRQGIENGEFNSHGQTPHELALWLISCIHGSLLTARVMGNQEPFECSFTSVLNYLEAK